MKMDWTRLRVGSYIFCVVLFWIAAPAVQAQSATRLQILLPGMTAAPGTDTGYAGSPVLQTTGIPFTVRINAVDDNWNVVPLSDQVSLSSSDPLANLPLPVNLVDGSALLSVTLNSGGTFTLTAYDDSNSSLNEATSPPVDVVHMDYFAITPIGEPYGGIPGEVKVGEEIRDVEITARRNQGELAGSYEGRVYLFQHTDYGDGRISPEVVQLKGGRWNGTVQVFRAGKKQAGYGVTGDVWIQASDALPPSDRMEIIINCDDAYDLYVNGQYIGSNDQWDTSRTYIVPYTFGKNVLAVHARDFGNVNGLLVEVRIAGQVVFRSNKNWVAAANPDSGWMTTHFDESGWYPVIDRGEYGVAPWYQKIEGFPSTSQSHWIWGSGSECYIRGSFYLEESSIPGAQSYTPHTGSSNRFCALPDQFNRLLSILPGETYHPGSRTGKYGTPTDQQSGEEFSFNLYATDQYWNLISGVNHEVSIRSSDPYANLPGHPVLNEGQASFPITLITPEVQTITVTDVFDENILAHSSSVFVLEGVNHYELSAVSSPRTAGEAFPVTITAVDQQGNIVTNFNGALDLSCSAGDQMIFPKEIVMVNGRWSGMVMVTRAESFVTISVQDRTYPPHSGTSGQFQVNPGAAKELQVLLPGETATPGVAPGKTGTAKAVLAGTNLTIRVNAVDDWWNVTPTVHDVVGITSSDPDALLPSDAPLNSGTRQFVVTLKTTGLHTISAQDQNSPSIANGESSQIRVNPGNMDHFIFRSISGPQIVGLPFSVTILAVDELDNVVNPYSGVVTLRASTGDNTMVPVTANFHNGSWTGNVTLKKASPGVYLQASDEANPPHSGASTEFEVQPGELVAFQVLVPGLSATPGVAPGYSGTPDAQNVGKPFSIVVNGVDAYWNVVTTATDSFALSSTDKTASLPAPTRLNQGTRNLSITLNEDGLHSISAFHLFNHQIRNGQTPLIPILPQSLDHFSFAPITGPVTAGEPLQITVRAETVEKTRVFSFSGTVQISASTGEGTVLPPTIGPFQDGQWIGQVVLTLSSDEVVLQVEDGAAPSHSGSSNPFVVIPGPFRKLQILLPGENAQPGSFSGKTGHPLDQQTGSQFEVLVRAVDEHWNPLGYGEDSLRIRSSDEQAILPMGTRMINGSATIPVIMGSIGNHAIMAEDLSNPQILAGVSSAFTVNPGDLDHFVFAPISNQMAGGEFFITITAADVVGNPVPGFNGHARLGSNTGAGTLSPGEIDFVDGSWSGKVTITRASDHVQLSCRDFAATPHFGQSIPFSVAPGPFNRLQILLPGETATPGVAPGKTGEVATQIAGDAVGVTVNAVDDWWNPVPSAIGTIGLTSTDENANLPLDAQLQTGTVTFNDFRFSIPGYWTITAEYKSNPQISSDTSPLIHVITGSIANFVFDAINSPQFVGDTMWVTIRAVDGSGTTVSNYHDMASVTASTGPGTIFIGEVQFQQGVWQGPVILTKAAQSVHLNIHDFSDVVRGNSNPFTLLPGTAAHLQLLLPGESPNPGYQQAKTGNPVAQTMGIPFPVTVQVTDVWGNRVAPDHGLKLHFASTDSIAVLPQDTMQTKSEGTYTLTLLTVGDQKISVQASNYPEFADTSTQLEVKSGSVDHFIFSPIADPRVAGKPFSVRIEARNHLDYPVTDYDGEIILSASTGNGTLSRTGVSLTRGFWQGVLTLTRADSGVVLYAADYVPAPNTHTGYSNAFTVRSDSLAGLQILFPGETPTPGVPPGKKGSPTPQIAGVPFSLEIRAVDAYWNLIPEFQDSIAIAISDTFAQLSENRRLVTGRYEIETTLRAAGRHLFVATVPGRSRISSAKTDSLSVSHNQFRQLLLLLPGETLLPGDIENDPLRTPGRAGIPSLQTSGLPFTVEALAVDDFWNLVPEAPAHRIHLYATDNSATIIPPDTVLVSGKARFSVTMGEGGNQVLRAIDASNAEIRSSLDGVVEVMVGGLHYEVVLNVETATAGEEFDMTVMFKNGIGEVVTSATHLVHLSAVDANDVNREVGSLKNSAFNLESGQRTLKQICTRAGWIRIKVEDEIGTDPAYSAPFQVVAGKVAAIQIKSPKKEIRGMEQMNLTTLITDASGNPVPHQQVQFAVVSGSGRVSPAVARSDSAGKLNVVFTGGKVNETNVIRAQVDSVYSEYEVIVNLTPSSQPDGIPVNYPNPFGVESEVTHIDYYLAEDADVTLEIYDLFGNLVWSRRIKAGMPGGLGRGSSSHPNSVIWAGVNDRGQKVGNGGYILIARAVANGKVIMHAQRKIAVLR